MDIAEDVKGIPDEVMKAAREVFPQLTLSSDPQIAIVAVARSILAERAASEARMLELLKDPVAVRLNWMRGGINADSIMAEVKARCAEIADAAADEQDVLALSADESNFAGYRQGERVAKSIASAIRSGER